MSTGRTLQAMVGGSWRRKISTRIAAPRTVLADLRRLRRHLRGDLVRAYARYHERRRTPGRVYRIPGRRCRMWLPIASGVSVAERRFGVFEPETFERLERLIAPGAVVVEVGACYGEFTIHLSRLVGARGQVYAFELFPPYFEIARKNVALNGLTNVVLLNRALGRSGSIPIRVNVAAENPYGSLDQVSRLDYSSRASNTDVSAPVATRVEVVSLLDYIRSADLTPDLLFMDIEGCELEVLADLQPLLRDEGRRPMIYFELHRAFYGQEGVRWLEALFDRSGYSCERVAGHLLCRPSRAAAGASLNSFVRTADLGGTAD